MKTIVMGLTDCCWMIAVMLLGILLPLVLGT